MKVHDENIRPEDLPFDLLIPGVNEKQKKKFDDINIKRKVLRSTEEEVKSIGISNKAKDSVCDENIRFYERF